MLKNTIIAILAGIAIAQRLTQPGDPDRGTVTVTTAIMLFLILIGLEDLWDKRFLIRRRAHTVTGAVLKSIRRIPQDIRSRIRWIRLRLRTYPAELAQRRRRRQMMRDYIQQLRDLPKERRAKNPEESEE